MWFRNLRLYRLAQPFTTSPEDLHQALQAAAFRPCGSLEPETVGWVPPLGRNATQLAHAGAGAILISARRETRLLPASVVNDTLAERVETLEAAEGRDIGRREKSTLREQIVHELLPRAFTRSSVTSAVVLPQDDWLLVDTASKARAEELLSLLRKALGSLPVAPPKVGADPSTLMTSWLAGAALPAGLALGDECELKEAGDDAGVVRVKRVDLLSDEIRTHLDAGRRVSRLALVFEDRMRFVLDDELNIRRLGFEDEVLEALDDVDSDDELARLDARFALLSLEVQRLLPQLIGWFGDAAMPESAAA
ncbi:recombination-associated protein RdgC [Thioalkalivibrio paradoxus]|uniref:Recombination-associated protein RdgC n=1 Tax=Thioalkalivibrio paradoxus ARh 1 TaxID=713585 RepID=W0DIJ3_9GAMM|nr:recombination-associated protein RdgC [Thioalkalivibrio paradoxus]AHE98226.1 recombinase RdgC [Thioalkalivibrio paradoxus ARh 1]